MIVKSQSGFSDFIILDGVLMHYAMASGILLLYDQTIMLTYSQYNWLVSIQNLASMRVPLLMRSPTLQFRAAYEVRPVISLCEGVPFSMPFIMQFRSETRRGMQTYCYRS